MIRSLLSGAALRNALWFLLAAAALPATAQLRAATPEEQSLDAAAFADTQRQLEQRLTDIESVVVVAGGRVLYQFYRDGSADTLRDVQSVDKSALSVLVGIALQQGRLRSIDVPVLELLPEWQALNADPRAALVTVRHVLTHTTGFAAGRRLPPEQAWARPFAAAPGAQFRYDNSMVLLLAAVLQQVTGLPTPEYARRELGLPLEMGDIRYDRTLYLRTIDLAKLGLLMLDGGRWGERQLVPADYARAATQPQNRGGPPVRMSYGLGWWIVPPEGPRGTFMATGYGGQMVWVHPPLELVLAVTSGTTSASEDRDHAVQLLRSGLLRAVERRLAERPR